MKIKNFYDGHQARTYLQDSIIMVGKEPAFITNIERSRDRKFSFNYNRLGDSKIGIGYIPDDSVDMNPVPLGLVNYKNFCIWVCRAPVRQWKIGLCASNAVCRKVGKIYDSPPMIRNHYVLNSKPMAKTILGDFPSIEEAVEKARHYKSSVAFSRDFFVDTDKEIGFQNKPGTVGTYNSGIIDLKDECFYLKEMVEEATA